MTTTLTPEATPLPCDPVAELRGEADELEAQLIEAFDELSDLRSSVHETPLLFAHALGRWRARIKETEARTRPGKREKGAGKLSRILGVKAATVKYSTYLYRAFPTERDLIDLMSRRRADGKTLSLWSIFLLSSPLFDQNRAEMFDKAHRENWSEKQVRAVVRASRPAEKSPLRNGGARHRTPDHLGSALERWRMDAVSYSKLGAASLSTGALDRLMAAGADDLTAEQVREVRDAILAMRSTIDQQLAVLTQLERSAKDPRVAKIFAKKLERQGVVATA